MSYTIKREFGKIYITFSNGDETKIGYTDDVEGLRQIVEASSWSNWKNKYIYLANIKNTYIKLSWNFGTAQRIFKSQKVWGLLLTILTTTGLTAR